MKFLDPLLSFALWYVRYPEKSENGIWTMKFFKNKNQEFFSGYRQKNSISWFFKRFLMKFQEKTLKKNFSWKIIDVWIDGTAHPIGHRRWNQAKFWRADKPFHFIQTIFDWFWSKYNCFWNKGMLSRLPPDTLGIIGWLLILLDFEIVISWIGVLGTTLIVGLIWLPNKSTTACCFNNIAMSYALLPVLSRIDWFAPFSKRNLTDLVFPVAEANCRAV